MTRRVIVAGSRDITDRTWVKRHLRHHVRIGDTIVSGGARGVDAIGEEYARENPGTRAGNGELCDYDLKLEVYPADWDKHKRAAGPIRNAQMAAVADVLIAFWDGKSPGTRHMINEALKRGLEVHVYRKGD